MAQPFVHRPVLFAEVMQWMRPREGGGYLDGTLGGGGHSEGILRAADGKATLYGIDRDPEAIAAASARLQEYKGFHDEVVHGKHSLLDKNPGDLWQKFAGLRALYGYTMRNGIGRWMLFLGMKLLSVRRTVI